MQDIFDEGTGLRIDAIDAIHFQPPKPLWVCLVEEEIRQHHEAEKAAELARLKAEEEARKNRHGRNRIFAATAASSGGAVNGTAASLLPPVGKGKDGKEAKEGKGKGKNKGKGARC